MNKKNEDHKLQFDGPVDCVNQFLYACIAEIEISTPSGKKKQSKLLIKEIKEKKTPAECNVNGPHFPEGMHFSPQELKFVQSVIAAGCKSIEADSNKPECVEKNKKNEDKNNTGN